jgi:general secretion pathway protein G
MIRLLRRLNRSGFTLIELMIVMSIVGILAAVSVPNYRWGLIKANEAVLKENLYTFRSTIDQYYADQGKFPESLNELVEKKYLREIPKDPFTKSSETWITVAPTSASEGETVEGSVYDVHSGSDLVGSNQKPYNEW